MSASDKPGQKPPDYDEEFTQAVEKFREQHKLPADDAVLLLVELFRIHQHHWDDLRRREMPSFEQFRTDIGSLSGAAKTFQQQVSTLIDALKKQPPGQPEEKISMPAAIFAVIAALLGGHLSEDGTSDYNCVDVIREAGATIRSLESVVQGFEERAARMESDIKDSQKRATELEAKVGAPFEKEERYHKLGNRQSENEEKLDLTKNQAPSHVDAAATDERDENSEKQIPKESVHRAQRAVVRV
jgi:hypothetical protein